MPHGCLQSTAGLPGKPVQQQLVRNAQGLSSPPRPRHWHSSPARSGQSCPIRRDCPLSVFCPSGGRIWWVTTIVWNPWDALVKVWNSFRVATGWRKTPKSYELGRIRPLLGLCICATAITVSRSATCALQLALSSRAGSREDPGAGPRVSCR